MEKKYKVVYLISFIIIIWQVNLMQEHLVWVWLGQVFCATIVLILIEIVKYSYKFVSLYVRLYRKRSRRLYLKKKNLEALKKNFNNQNQ